MKIKYYPIFKIVRNLQTAEIKTGLKGAQRWPLVTLANFCETLLYIATELIGH